MMHSDIPPAGNLDVQLGPPRDRVPTLPFELEEYARWSCLPDEDDDLVFSAGPILVEIMDRVPRLAGDRDLGERLTPCEAMLLALVDAVSPVSVLVQLTGIDPQEALVAMCDLHARGLVTFG